MPSKYCDRLPRCKNAWWCAIDYRPSENVKCFDAMTNADRISKTPEALAEFLIRGGDCPPERMYPDSCPNCDRVTPKVCYDCWLDWLNQEATE